MVGAKRMTAWVYMSRLTRRVIPIRMLVGCAAVPGQVLSSGSTSPRLVMSRCTPCEWQLPGPSQLHGGAFPCQDASGVNVLGKGATGARTSLFWELGRLEQIIEQVFPDLPFIDVPENVASMSAMDCDLISEGLGRHPIFICSGGISRARRPRLYWPSFPVCAGPGVAISHSELHDLVGLRAPVEPTEIWVSEGWCWPFSEDRKLPTFTRSIPRR